jgi:hypothetical protein
MPDPRDPANTVTNPAWWRDQAQGAALAAGDITPFHATIDFSKLAARATENSGVPTTGLMDRILASHFQTAPGNNYAVACFPGAVNGGTNCPGEYQGNLQPYAIYVPAQARPPAGYGMTLLLHSLGANYNQYLSSHNQSQFGERGAGSIVITSESARTASTPGTIDVVSQGFGRGDPTPSATQHGAGTLTGGTIPAIPYVSQSKTWGPVPSTPASDSLSITATNVATMTIDVARAHVDCNVHLAVTSDGPLTVTLAGCPSSTTTFF